MKTPNGGCRKECEGLVIQTFNEKGELIHQEFKCGDIVEYKDEHGICLDDEDERNDFYAPYKMYQQDDDLEPDHRD